MIDQAVSELEPIVGVREACRAVGEPRARWYRRHRKSPAPPAPERVPTPQPRALTEVERKEVRRVLNSDEHVDEAPATVYAKLLDAGVYLASTPPCTGCCGPTARCVTAAVRPPTRLG